MRWELQSQQNNAHTSRDSENKNDKI